MDTFTLLGLIFLGMALLFIMPFCILWALNTLFALSLAYTWTNWMAIFILWSTLALLSTK